MGFRRDSSKTDRDPEVEVDAESGRERKGRGKRGKIKAFRRLWNLDFDSWLRHLSCGFAGVPRSFDMAHLVTVSQVFFDIAFDDY